MKGIDTNVLLRLIVRDDLRQAELALDFIRTRTTEEPAFISLIVVVELIWSLRRRYKYPKAAVRQAMAALLETREFVFEEEEYLSTLFLTPDAPKGDAADRLIAFCASRAGCTATVTFDQRAAETIRGMELLT